MTSLGERLERARRQAGLSTRELASTLRERRGLEISYGTVAKYERGESQPRADYLVALCELCDVHPLWLLTEKGREDWGEEERGDAYAEGMIDAAERVLEGLRRLPAFRRAARVAPDEAEAWREATGRFIQVVRETSETEGA